MRGGLCVEPVMAGESRAEAVHAGAGGLMVEGLSYTFMNPHCLLHREVARCFHTDLSFQNRAAGHLRQRRAAGK